MDQLHSKSVVVGIDGSQAAVNAAKWAVDEAISRQIPFVVSMSSGAAKRNPHRKTFRTGSLRKTFRTGSLNVAKRRSTRQMSP